MARNDASLRLAARLIAKREGLSKTLIGDLDIDRTGLLGTKTEPRSHRRGITPSAALRR